MGRLIMRRVLLALLVSLMVMPVATAAEIKKIPLSEGRKKDNMLQNPVIQPTAPLEIGEFVQGFPSGNPLHRKKSGAVMGGKSKTKLDLGALLSNAMRTEAHAMGFEQGEGGWQIEGTLKALYYDLRSNGWAVFYYGTMVVELRIVSPEGESRQDTLYVFNYDPEYAKKPSFAIAEMLVEGAQEILARLNVRHFNFPADPSVNDVMAELSAKGLKGKDLECTAVGLSGSRDVVLPLLDLLQKTKSENDRAEIVDSLARIEDPRVISVLAERYASEDEDVRWFTLKAMGYLGTDEALEVVRDRGLEDKNKACKALAEDLLDPSALGQP
jgi:hypothetical protein